MALLYLARNCDLQNHFEFFPRVSRRAEHKVLSSRGNRWMTLLRSIITSECHKMGLAQPFDPIIPDGLEKNLYPQSNVRC